MTLTIHDDIEQRSPEWFAVRRGIVTASTVGRLITTATDPLTVACPSCEAEPGTSCVSLSSKARAPIKSTHAERIGEPTLVVGSKDTNAVHMTLIAERISGWTDPTFVSDDMLRGIMHEPLALDAYAKSRDVEVKTVGFAIRDDWGFRLGASPDGLVGDDGGCEVKCPRAKGHIATVLADEVPAHHMAQVQASMLVLGRSWWDYISFCAGLPLWVKRVHADEQWHKAIVAATADFEAAAGDAVADFNAKTKGLPATERVPDPETVELNLA